MKYVILVAFVIVPCGLILGLRSVARHYRSRDHHIDGLIRPPVTCTGMEKMDWNKSNRAGERRWAETVRAQQRGRCQPLGDKSRVVAWRG